MSKLVLTDREIELIKGLISHTELNNQQIQSMFTYLERNINHRVIGAIRSQSKPRYVQNQAASEDEVNALLYRSSKLGIEAKRLGLLPSTKQSDTILKAIEIMKSAILIYNNNTLSTRSESFIVLAVIAWTYALHTFYRSLNVEPVYLDEAGNPKQTPEGKPRLWELSTCTKHAQCPLSLGVTNNLRYIIAIRNEVEHRSCDDINEGVQSKIQAAALNFVQFCSTQFGMEYDFSSDLGFTIQLTALKLHSPNTIMGDKGVTASVSAVNKLIEAEMSSADYNDPEYAFRIHVIPKITNNPKKADQAVVYSPIGSKAEMAIKHVERPKFMAKQAIGILKDRGFEHLTMHGFIQTWKSNDLKIPGKGFAIQLGSAWFWYQEGIDKIAELLADDP